MTKKILIVSQDSSVALGLVEVFGEGLLDISFIDSTQAAIANVKKIKYDAIFLGDKLDTRGDVYDVAQEIKNFSKNKGTPVFCVGMNSALASRVVNFLRPYAMRIDPRDVSAYKENISFFLSKPLDTSK